MRILVTGAAGFIGSHLAESLADRGHTVIGLDGLTPSHGRSRKYANLACLEEQGIEVARCDLVTDALGPVLRGVEAVYHLAGQPGLSADTDRDVFVRNNVYATERLLRALADHSSLNAFLFTSSSSVYGTNAIGPEAAPLRPASIYGRTKRRAEAVVRAHAQSAAWDACIFRLFSVYSPRERPDKLIPTAIRCARTRTAFPLYAGSKAHERSFTYVGDAVAGMAAALSHWARCAGETINLGTPTTASTPEVLDAVAKAVGRPLCIRRAPARPGDQRRTRARIDKARRLLNFEPATSLREGLAAAVAWMRSPEGSPPRAQRLV